MKLRRQQQAKQLAKVKAAYHRARREWVDAEDGSEAEARAYERMLRAEGAVLDLGQEASS